MIQLLQSLLFFIVYLTEYPIQAWTSPSAVAATTSPIHLHRDTPYKLQMTATFHDNNSKEGLLPRLDLPPPICSTEPGTWAYDTMSRRVDAEILHRTEQDNLDFFQQHPVIKERFQALRQELQQAATTKLTLLTISSSLSSDNSEDDNIEEEREWNELLLEPLVAKGETWLSAPWMVTEFYLYRRLMQALDYWNPNSPGYLYDPFYPQKRAGLVSSVASAEALFQRLDTTTATSFSPEQLALAVSIALWGNKMDLSLWPANADHANVDVFSEILAAAAENLLHDDTAVLTAHCQKLQSATTTTHVDIIVDNAGFELVTDLILGQYLIESGVASVVTFQLKSHPTFVSDALEKDLMETVQYYLSLDQYPHAQAAARKWKQFIETGKWKCVQNSFWCQGFAMWDMTEPLRTDMATRCDLAFVKGDANYRRLLGDRQWDLTASFQDVVGCYFPCRVCALRTLKAELGCGMDADKVKRAQELDENWMVNGRFGVIQFGTGAEK